MNDNSKKDCKDSASKFSVSSQSNSEKQSIHVSQRKRKNELK